MSPGEVVDKITILQIKDRLIHDAEKHAHVARELQYLQTIFRQSVSPSAPLLKLSRQLYKVNRRLWKIEDRLRFHEQQKQFDQAFIELARQVYKLNDGRAQIKREINELLGAAFSEQKSYISY